MRQKYVIFSNYILEIIMLRFYTCALLPFLTNDYFFTRDSGLLCRSLQKIGVDCKVVLPTPPPTPPPHTHIQLTMRSIFVRTLLEPLPMI